MAYQKTAGNSREGSPTNVTGDYGPTQTQNNFFQAKGATIYAKNQFNQTTTGFNPRGKQYTGIP